MNAWFWHPDHVDSKHIPGVSHFWRHVSLCLPLQRLYSAFVTMLFRMRLTGAGHLPVDRPCIFISNHGSHYDGFFLFAVLLRICDRGVVPVVWFRMLEYPIVGPILRCLRAVPISHEADFMSQRSIHLRGMIEQIQAGRHLLILPEGRRGDVLGTFQPGAGIVAIRTGSPLVPITLRGVQPLFKELDRLPRLRGNVEVVIHPPLFPEKTPDEMVYASKLMEQARARVATALDYPRKEDA
ncbi:MAG: lysophospholipid acyltransferase family protein [Candidatus Methylacidiphilales bacterium]|nr:lysophospholipid acyltransferase family protein [Candidatus Methylacidiphilales bacterium]